MFNNQERLPALSTFNAIKAFLKTDLEYGILVDFQLAEIGYIVESLHEANKKVLIHVDMIKGLKPDKYGAIYLIQQLKVDGLISIQPQVIQVAKDRGVIGMQRIFLKDSFSFKKSLEVVRKSQPDCVEVLPAISGKIISVIHEYVNLEVYCGGLLQSEEQIQDCLDSGAVGVTVSNPQLWTK